MHRSKTAHELLAQICFEKAADIVLISEQYRDREGPGWYVYQLIASQQSHCSNLDN